MLKIGGGLEFRKFDLRVFDGTSYSAFVDTYNQVQGGLFGDLPMEIRVDTSKGHREYVIYMRAKTYYDATTTLLANSA